MRGAVWFSVLTFAFGGAVVHAVESAKAAPRAAQASAPDVPKKPPEPPRVKLSARPGGWTISELCAAATSATGRPILLDRVTPSTLNQKIECTSDVELPAARLFAWVQAVLYPKRLVLVPVGPPCAKDERAWQLLDECNPAVIQCPTPLDESALLEHADRDGLFVTTTFQLADGVDSTQMRNALCMLSTQTAGVGRIADVPGRRSLVVCDFAPVLAAMKRAVDAVGAAAPPPPKPSPRMD
jgi:hypothetical protein